jgi:hypothetical protein
MQRTRRSGASRQRIHGSPAGADRAAIACGRGLLSPTGGAWFHQRGRERAVIGRGRLGLGLETHPQTRRGTIWMQEDAYLPRGLWIKISEREKRDRNPHTAGGLASTLESVCKTGRPWQQQ